ncbi:hypothetical protein DFJ73DRAFT_773212 [Zopfochytrium polystomum]|nr:hypothetical protein DFJ73DRAFT_773212 [Zopfochytrium polystomum]
MIDGGRAAARSSAIAARSPADAASAAASAADHADAGNMDHGAMGPCDITYKCWALRFEGFPSLMLSSVVIFLWVVAHEWFQTYRTGIDRRCQSILDKTEHDIEDAPKPDSHHPRTTASVTLSREIDALFGWLQRFVGPLFYIQLVRSVLYAASTFSSMMLMMVFMTLNGYLVMAVVAGSGTAFFLFRRGALAPSSNGAGAVRPALECH